MNKRNSYRGGSQKNNTNNGNSNSKKYNGRRNFRNNNKPEFKFQLHDSLRKGSYTCKKLTEAIVTKIQKEFDGGRWLVKSIREKAKSGPPEPELQISNKVDNNEKARENQRFLRAYESKMTYHHEMYGEI